MKTKKVSADNIINDMDVGLVPVSSFINNHKSNESDFMQAVDNVILQVTDKEDITIADGAIDSLLNLQHVTGRAFAKMLWFMREYWQEKNLTEEKGDEFEDHMEERHGLKKVRMDRYIRVWEYTENNKLPKDVWSRPMKDQIAIASMLSQGYDPSKEQWTKLVRAEDNNEVLRVIRIIKKKPAKKGSMQITMDRSGNLHAWVGEKRVFIGYLDSKHENDDPIVKKAIERIVTNTGVKRK